MIFGYFSSILLILGNRDHANLFKTVANSPAVISESAVGSLTIHVKPYSRSSGSSVGFSARCSFCSVMHISAGWFAAIRPLQQPPVIPVSSRMRVHGHRSWPGHKTKGPPATGGWLPRLVYLLLRLCCQLVYIIDIMIIMHSTCPLAATSSSDT